MAGISGPTRGCPGGRSSPLAASQTFGAKHRAMLRADRQSHLCEFYFQQPERQWQLSVVMVPYSQRSHFAKCRRMDIVVDKTVNKQIFTW